MTHPALLQINTRVLLTERGRALGRPATLDDLEDGFLDGIRTAGFDWVWPLGVWQTGPAGRAVSRADERLVEECRHALPDLRPDDIAGSPFAIAAYDVHRDFGGDAALARLRDRLQARGLRLLLDFVPNHTAPDHPWVASHPEYYVGGTEEDLAREPRNYTRVGSGGRRGAKAAVLAYGRDPYFGGWPDTLQLNYRHAGFREAQVRELARVADRCDGVRCDMAMLVQPATFRRTWGDRALPADGSPPRDEPFWPEAIGAVRRRNPDFLFIAEVYWDLEWELQQHGFDYTYDKRLYDRLRAGDAGAVRGHLCAAADFQNRSVRFLENHDEPRAAAAFAPGMHQAAATIAFLVPGMRFFHEGQLEGRRTRVSMHLGRRPPEPIDEELRAFYARLLDCLRRPEARDGAWALGTCRPAWDGNPTHAQFIVSWWHQGDRRLITAVNYAPGRGQCYVSLTIPGLEEGRFALIDLLGEARYERTAHELCSPGLYLDLPAWGRHVFELRQL
jgi:hypothetical protein